MKITDILVESQVNEGPILNKIGSAVGKGVGTLAKGVGAVAGGVAGLGRALKKGYQAGKQTVGGAGDDDGDTTTTTTSGGSSGSAGGSSTSGGGTGGSSTTAPTPTPSPTGDTKQRSNRNSSGSGAGSATVGTTPTGEPRVEPNLNAPVGGGTDYAQVQSAVGKLNPDQKKEIVTMLQSDPKVKAAMQKTAKQAKPATATPVAGKPSAGAGAFGAMAKQLGGEKPAAEPAAPSTATSSTGGTIEKTPGGVKHTANPNNPNASKTGAPKGNYDGNTGEPLSDKAKADAAFDASPEGKALQAKVDAMGTAPASGEQPTTAAGKKKPTPRKKAAPSQAEIDADRARLMGVTSDSVVRTGNIVSESFRYFKPR